MGNKPLINDITNSSLSKVLRWIRKIVFHLLGQQTTKVNFDIKELLDIPFTMFSCEEVGGNRLVSRLFKPPQLCYCKHIYTAPALVLRSLDLNCAA